jgi:hypothetical protein
MARTVKVPAHTRKNGVKVKAYSYTVGGKAKRSAAKAAKRLTKKGPSRTTFNKVNKLRQRMFRSFAPRLTLTTEGGTGSIRTKR